LIVEVDGGQHDDQIERDERRSAWLAAQGFRVIRFWNDDVLKSMDSVLQKILEVLEEISSERKSRGRRGEEGRITELRILSEPSRFSLRSHG
jgi:hypothetical protein